MNTRTGFFPASRAATDCCCFWIRATASRASKPWPVSRPRSSIARSPSPLLDSGGASPAPAALVVGAGVGEAGPPGRLRRAAQVAAVRLARADDQVGADALQG